ncbi:OmpA family protein [Parasphingorhabdus marina DSM 22363]|uniref:OmpA family protein n=1 Tax=Parasphingorhabdus marina DSM 22363 TaxID=1123272 RepID=A0A1N6CWF3_9SPHN|nr:OmpA family protein [Parasphingorhabdus marina]SIN62815.1 OmpA family protein [Parasphingorhabdus marina DSM 22363]
MRLMHRPRWLTSFLDLVLIMLGAMALLIANKLEGNRVLEAVSDTFGGPGLVASLPPMPVDQIFENQEARLSAEGIVRIQTLSRQVSESQNIVHIRVPVEQTREDRLQGWELAAARTASIAWQLRQNGVAEDRIVPRMPDSAVSEGPAHVTLELRTK